MNQPVRLSDKIELLDTAGVGMKKAMSCSIFTEGTALLLCVLGIIIVLDKLFDIGLTSVSYVVGATASMLMLFVYRLERFRATAVIGVLVGVIGLGALHIDSVIYGALMLNARIVSKINAVMDTQYSYYTTTGDEYVAMLALEIGVPIVLAILLGLFTVNVKRPLLLLFIALPINLFCCTLQAPPLLLPSAMLMIAVVLTYAKRASASIYPRKSRYKPPAKLVRVMSERITVITAVIVLPIAMVLATALQPAETAGGQLLVSVVDFFSKDNISQITENIIPPELTFDSNTGIGGSSTLGRTDGVSFGGETHLRVTQLNNTPTYLRAFVGVSYDRNRWQTRAKNVPGKFRDMDDTFEAADFDPRMMSREVAKFIAESGGKGMFSGLSNSMMVENVGADTKYSYMPYLLRLLPSDNEVGYQGDGMFAAGDAKRAYDMTVLYDDVIGAYQIPTASMREYIDAYTPFKFSDPNERGMRDLYSEYVQAVYTAIPESRLELLPGLAKRVAGSTSNIVDAAGRIVAELDERCNYNLQPGKTPSGKDFAEYFVFNSTQGYCSHFATAATLMLRAAGYPARYVEGYVLTQEDIDRADELGMDYVDINDTNAHAWVELYDPVFGWFPYEATPAYFDGVPSDNFEQVTITEPSSVPSVPSSAPSSEISSAQSSESSSSVISDATSNTTSSGIDETKEPIKIVIPKSAIIIMIVLASLAVLILLLRLRRRMVVARMERAFAADTPSAVMAMYRHINRILARYGYDPNAYIDLREYGKEVERHQNVPHFAHIIDVVLMVQFSPLEIERRELTIMREAVKLLADRMNNGLGIAARLYYRYINIFIL